MNKPKFIISTTGDEFFMIDDAKFYYDQLQGETYLRYNMSHNVRKRAFSHMHPKRLKSACASAQPDLSPFCPHEETLHP